MVLSASSVLSLQVYGNSFAIVQRQLVLAVVGLAGAYAVTRIPMTLLLPPLVARLGGTGVLPWSFAALTVAGWGGVLAAPTAAPWLWAVLLGLGGCTFTWVLIMFGRRTRTTEGTAALSAFAQSVGYLLAGLGPFGTGLLHDLTGSWTVPVVVLMAAAVLIGFLATTAPGGGAPVDGLFYGGNAELLGKQVLAAVVVMVFSFVLTYIIGKLIDMTIGFRIDPEDEVSGIDQVEHLESAYDYTGGSGGSPFKTGV